MSNVIPIRSLAEHRSTQLPVIGTIRPGIKVLTKRARANPDAARIYQDGLLQGQSFDEIEKSLLAQGVERALTPKNTPYFVVHLSDFKTAELFRQFCDLYGEIMADGEVRVRAFPAMFPADDWLVNLPHRLATYSRSGIEFFSEYTDGTRYCMSYEPPEPAPTASRAKRSFNGRRRVARTDEHIPNGKCSPDTCPQYQAAACNLDARLHFFVPGMEGLGVFALPTRSFFVVQEARAAMQLALAAKGTLRGLEFRISKEIREFKRYDAETGKMVPTAQALTVLTAPVDLTRYLNHDVIEAPALPAPAAALPEAVKVTPDELLRSIGQLGAQLGVAPHELKAWGRVKFGAGWTRSLSRLSTALDYLRGPDHAVIRSEILRLAASANQADGVGATA